MANALMGETAFEFEGRRLTLVFDVDALFEIEDRLDIGFAALLEQLSGGKLKTSTIATILSCALERHQPREFDRAAAARMLLIGKEPVAQALVGALSAMMVQVGDAGAAHPGSPAPKTRTPAQSGTGRRR